MRNDSATTGTSDDGFRRVEVITGVGRRRRWTDEEKAWIVAESLDPATSVSAVARRYGLHLNTVTIRRRLQKMSADLGRVRQLVTWRHFICAFRCAFARF